MSNPADMSQKMMTDRFKATKLQYNMCDINVSNLNLNTDRSLFD